MNYRMLLSYSKSEPVCEARRLRAQGLRLKNILECLEGMDLLEERKSDIPHPGTRSRTDGISLKQGLDMGRQSLCVGGNGETTTTPQRHTRSPDLFCFLFLSMKDLKLQMALKKKNGKISYFRATFTAKKNIVKVIPLFTHSYF